MRLEYVNGATVPMDPTTPLYNSRIFKVYQGYLKKNYPDVSIDMLLEYAGITPHELEDPAHWLNQQQVDRFHEILTRQTRRPDISREVGRYASSAEGIGATKVYALGLLSPTIIYASLNRFLGEFTRAHIYSSKRLSANRVEISVKMKDDLSENPYQCQNRYGFLESLGKLFTGKPARVDHPLCLHQGGDCCRYVVTLDRSPAFTWKRIRNYTVIFSAFLFLVLLFLQPSNTWWLGFLSAFSAVVIPSFMQAWFERKEIVKTLEHQGEAAKEHLDQLNARYNNALLVQEIGQAISRIAGTEKLVETVMQIMAKRLDFDRSILMLVNKDKTHLGYAAGYGCAPHEEELLRRTDFHLDKPDSKGVFVRAFKEQKPFLKGNLFDNGESMSIKSENLAKKMGVESIICVPIVYEMESLGILAVDTMKSKRVLTKSDINLLMGIASQTAVSIVNAQAFQKIRESEEKYRNILEGIEDGYFEVNLSGDLTFVNEGMCRILGYERDELIGLNHRQYMNAETAEKVTKTFRTVYDSGKATKTYDWKLIAKDGHSRVVQVLVSLIRNSHMKTIGFRGIARDITDRIRADREKERLEAQLHQAQKMEAIGTLAGGVAHDLNNILSGLVSYPELLLMDLHRDNPLREPIEQIQKSGKRASAIVQDLLTLARRGVAVSEVVNLNQTVSEYLKSPEFKNTKSLYPQSAIEADLASNLPNITGSPVHLAKSLMNLITNALEAMPKGGRIRVSTENCYLNEPVKGYSVIQKGEYVLLSVTDDGIGIAPEEIDRIFEPFYTKKVMGRSGSGLGMAVVWGMVQDHKGYIDVSSSPQGTTFKLYFPVAKKAPTTERLRVSLDQYRGHGEEILIVDDMEGQRSMATRLLNKLGYTAHSVASGEGAIEYLKRRPADLLILDMIMGPGIDGLETFQQILKINPQQKAIIASGYSESDRVREAQRLGVGAYVQKPYTIETIGMAIRKELDQKKNASHPEPKKLALGGSKWP